jgi:hypothetical protein
MHYLIHRLLASRGGRIFLSGLCSLLSIAFATLFYGALADMRLLASNHANVVADVTAMRQQVKRGNVTGWDLQYSFKLGSGPARYRLSERGPLARKEIWASVSQEEWEKAEKSGVISVEYYPPNPNVSTTTYEFENGGSTLWIAMIVSVLIALASVGWLLWQFRPGAREEAEVKPAVVVKGKAAGKGAGARYPS